MTLIALDFKILQDQIENIRRNLSALCLSVNEGVSAVLETNKHQNDINLKTKEILSEIVKRIEEKD